MAAASSSFSSMPDSVYEGLEFSSETNKILLMNLMEETQEDHQYYADDRLVSIIQSLEAEISSTNSSYDMDVGHVDDQDCSTSSSISFSTDWDDMEVVFEISSSFFIDEEMMMDAWSLCAVGKDDSTDFGELLATRSK